MRQPFERVRGRLELDLLDLSADKIWPTVTTEQHTRAALAGQRLAHGFRVAIPLEGMTELGIGFAAMSVITAIA